MRRRFYNRIWAGCLLDTVSALKANPSAGLFWDWGSQILRSGFPDLRAWTVSKDVGKGQGQDADVMKPLVPLVRPKRAFPTLRLIENATGTCVTRTWPGATTSWEPDRPE
jgi:hypothetical protein